ncbi:TIGR04282 family arsenosugar biosynthesis glycosyltransferase [Alkalinema sp. FACHB-956]|nr:TIGR04282 family arsenosugar biosynthesis glycosyltransferase [Alkalinema sp. FACHB-956]
MVKTRLIPALGAEGAAQLHRRLAEYTIAQAADFLQSRSAREQALDINVEIRFAGADQPAMADWLGTEYTYVHQGEGDLGDRMARSISDGFAQGYSAVILIGTDCPEVTPDLLSEAFSHLSTSDMVIGPALDGGYYLIGVCNNPGIEFSKLFENIHWSTHEVLAKTLNNANSLSLKIKQLKVLSDIDTPEDLKNLDLYQFNSNM